MRAAGLCFRLLKVCAAMAPLFLQPCLPTAGFSIQLCQDAGKGAGRQPGCGLPLFTSLGTLREGCLPLCIERKPPAPSDPHHAQGCCWLKGWPRRDGGLKLLWVRCFCETGRGNALLVCSLISKDQLKSASFQRIKEPENGTMTSRGCRNH